MRYIYLLIINLLLLGCSTKDINDVLVATSGNKPAQFFQFPTSYDANHYMFHHKDFDILMLETKQQDWIDMGGWNGAYIYGGIGVGLEIKEEKKYGDIFGYGINITSSVGKYGEGDKEREKNNIEYFKKKYPHRVLSNGDEVGIDRHIERHGKENYFCEVSNVKDERQGAILKRYECHKANIEKTKDKSVTITFIYTKSPNLPERYKHLAKEYTYEDLLKRSKRVLDSLYIKDGWDK